MTDYPVKTETRAIPFDPWNPVPRRRQHEGVVFSPYFPGATRRPDPNLRDDAKPRRERVPAQPS